MRNSVKKSGGEPVNLAEVRAIAKEAYTRVAMEEVLAGAGDVLCPAIDRDGVRIE